MIFSATLRWTGAVCSAMKTDAVAAFADLLQQLVAADHRAGPIRSGRRVEGRGEHGLLLHQQHGREQLTDLTAKSGCCRA